MPDIVPVSLQDIMHGWKPELREYKSLGLMKNYVVHTYSKRQIFLPFAIAVPMRRVGKMIFSTRFVAHGDKEQCGNGE